jgi:uncharacterized protein (DUF302 family)
MVVVFFVAIFMAGCSSIDTTPKISTPTKAQNQIYDIRTISSNNTDESITIKSIEKAFVKNGFYIPGNNNMNRPFQSRFGNTHYKKYNLAMYIEHNLTYKLLKKYPTFASLTPLTMSIWEDKDGHMNISTLSIDGISRVTNIPKDDIDLIKYDKLITKTLKDAMPQGKFIKPAYTQTKIANSYAIEYIVDISKEDTKNLEEYIEDFEAEFEGELIPLGFLLPNFTNVQEEIFDKESYTDVYDYFHTYSICKFDVIYSISKQHPQAGAWAPCSIYLYKRKDETKMHIGFLGVKNWIKTLNIKNPKSINLLNKAQNQIVGILDEISN